MVGVSRILVVDSAEAPAFLEARLEIMNRSPDPIGTNIGGERQLAATD
jgi:hypothetical protein